MPSCEIHLCYDSSNNVLFWRLSCGFNIIIKCFHISFWLNYSDKLKAILLSNKRLASRDKAGVDSATFEAEEWSDDDPCEGYMKKSDCSNTAKKSNRTGGI